MTLDEYRAFVFRRMVELGYMPAEERKRTEEIHRKQLKDLRKDGWKRV